MHTAGAREFPHRVQREGDPGLGVAERLDQPRYRAEHREHWRATRGLTQLEDDVPLIVLDGGMGRGDDDHPVVGVARPGDVWIPRNGHRAVPPRCSAAVFGCYRLAVSWLAVSAHTVARAVGLLRG